MKKLFNLFILTFSILSNCTTTQAQTTYTWDGSSSTDWNTAANWTPAAVPTSSDHVTLANVTNDPVLDADRTVNNLTLSAGTLLDLGGHTLTVSGTATLNAGTVHNGVFYKTAGSVSFAGVTMDCEVDVDATTTISSTNHFIGEARLQKITGWTGTCRFEAKADLKLTNYNTFFGGNVFNDTTIITAASAQGYSQGIGYSAVDSFYAPVTINAILHQNFYFGNATGGTWFADDVTINNFGTTGTYIYIGGHASSVNHFEGDIILNTDSTAGHISFNLGTNIHDGELLFGDRGYNSGVLTLKAYTQSAAYAIDLSAMDHTSTLFLGPDLTLEGALNGPNKNTTLYANCTFKDDVTLQKILGWSGYTTCEGKADLKMVNYNTFVGGNVYMDTTIITAASAQGYSQRIGHVVPDTFLAPVTIQMLSNQDLYIGNGSAGNYYADDVTIKNSGWGSSKIYVNSGSTTSSTFNGDIYVESTSGGGIHFYAGTIDHNGLLKVGPSGFSSGILTLTEYTQLTSGTINLSSISGTSSISVLSDADITADFNYSGSRPITLTGATFRGNVDLEATSLPVTNCEFQGTTRLEKTGAGTNNLNGGNTFRGTTTIENSSSSNYVYWGNSVADTFMTDLTLINHSTQPLWMNYTSTGHYAGDITLQGTSGKVIRFGNTTTGRKAVFNGSIDQDLTVATSGLDVQLYRAEVNKGGGRLKLNSNAKVDYELALTDGIIEASNGAIVSLADGVAPSASDSSYIEGAVKKVGNDAFTFPVGRNGVYRPIGISAPGNVTDAFTAEYLNEDPDGLYDTSLIDTTINEVESNEYWTLARTTGTSNVTVTLSWDDMSCGFDTLTELRVSAWNGTKWKDLGIGSPTGNDAAGTIATASASTIYGAYTLATVDTFDCVPCRADAGVDKVIYWSYDIRIGSTEIGGLTYQWNPTSGLDDSTIADPIALQLSSTEYQVEVTNSSGCVATDEMHLEVIMFEKWHQCIGTD